MKSEYEIIRLESVDSTNTYIKNHPELWAKQFCAVIARQQTGGRGRHNRVWHATPGKDLTFSMLFIPNGKIEDQAVITIMAGLAVYRALSTYVPSGLNLKWPNDIYVNDKKIGGILCEMVMADKRPMVVIGVGININNTEFPNDIISNATSMKSVSNIEYNINVIFQDIMDQIIPLLRDINVPLKEEFLREWATASRSIGSNVVYYLDGQKKTGNIVGINNDGSLRIQNSDGSSVDGYRGEVFFSNDV